jgi:4-alpha-glucanotransferase
VYTGTHDNNTTLGWYEGLDQKQKDTVQDYYARPSEPMPWPLIKSALASVSDLAILPLQDLLSLDGQHRMNTPGTTLNNWLWQFSWSQLNPQLAEKLAVLNRQYKRSA